MYGYFESGKFYSHITAKLVRRAATPVISQLNRGQFVTSSADICVRRALQNGGGNLNIFGVK